MPRPAKKAEETRTLRVDIRLNTVEQKGLAGKAAADGLSMSDYIRVTVLNSKPVQKKINPERAALISGLGQLGKIGSNLNQIAAELHRERITLQDSQVSGERITAALDDLKLLSDHLLNILTGGH